MNVGILRPSRIPCVVILIRYAGGSFIYDDVQYGNHGVRNRNQVMPHHGGSG